MIKKLAEKLGAGSCASQEDLLRYADVAWDYFLAYEAEVLIGYFSNLKMIEERLGKIESFLVL